MRQDLLRWQSDLISHRQGEPFIVVGVNLLPRIMTLDDCQAFIGHVSEVAAELAKASVLAAKRQRTVA